jgi:hypothetical protein
VQTIFTLAVRKPAGGTLNYEEAWCLHKRLNEDIAEWLPAAITAQQRAIASKLYHIGQPARLTAEGGLTIGALRVAAGARLVSRVAFDPTLGATPEDRLFAHIDSAVQVLDKIELIMAHWSVLRQQMPSAEGTLVSAAHVPIAAAMVANS